MMFETYRIRNDIKLADDTPQIDPAKLSAKNAENAALREKLQKYIDNEKVILAQNQELRARLERATSAAAAGSRTAQAGSSSAASSASGDYH